MLSPSIRPTLARQTVEQSLSVRRPPPIPRTRRSRLELESIEHRRVCDWVLTAGRNEQGTGAEGSRAARSPLDALTMGRGEELERVWKCCQRPAIGAGRLVEQLIRYPVWLPMVVQVRREPSPL